MENQGKRKTRRKTTGKSRDRMQLDFQWGPATVQSKHQEVSGKFTMNGKRTTTTLKCAKIGENSETLKENLGQRKNSKQRRKFQINRGRETAVNNSNQSPEICCRFSFQFSIGKQKTTRTKQTPLQIVSWNPVCRQLALCGPLGTGSY